MQFAERVHRGIGIRSLLLKNPLILFCAVLQGDLTINQKQEYPVFKKVFIKSTLLRKGLRETGGQHIAPSMKGTCYLVLPLHTGAIKTLQNSLIRSEIKTPNTGTLFIKWGIRFYSTLIEEAFNRSSTQFVPSLLNKLIAPHSRTITSLEILGISSINILRTHVEFRRI
jgi:hypothetical protein